MAECCVRSPARTFCQESSLIEEVPGLANAPRTEGGQCKKSIPAGSWPFSPQEHLSSSLQCLPQLPCPPPGTRAPSSPLSKPTSPRDCSPEELWVSSQLFDSRQPLNIEDIPVSPILLKSSLFNSEILLCQSPTLNFFFYCFDTYLFEMSLFPLVCLKPCHSWLWSPDRPEGTFLPNSA